MNIDDFVLSLSSILTRIDEYGLYCHYLGFDPDIRGTYSSPIREVDDSPSFSFYNAYPDAGVEFLWKDGALDKSGTIVQLVQYMYGLTYTHALEKIDSDFKLGFTDGTFATTKRVLTYKKPEKKEEATIAVNSKTQFTEAGLDFWISFHITEETLNLFDVTELYGATINSNQVGYKELAFAYRIGDKYKIYCPYNSKFKFVNNFPIKLAEGFFQLKKKSDTLIITKSLKDVMVLHELGYEAISPKSETTLLPKQYFKWINTHYKNVRVLFDNDMKHNGDKYPYDKIYIPIDSECKDVSDFIREYGKEETKWMLEKILNLGI